MKSRLGTLASLVVAAGLIAGCAPDADRADRDRVTEDVWVRGVGPGIERVQGREAYRDLPAGFFDAFAIERLEVEIEDVIVQEAEGR